MKQATRIVQLLSTSSMLIIIWAAMLNQTIFAQENGYWDDRFTANPSSDNDSFIHAIAVTDNGDMYASGLFLGAAIKKWNGAGWSSLGGSNGSVYALAMAGNDIYAGGDFTTIGGIQANRVAKYNLITQSWSALETDGVNGINHRVDGYYHRVYALAVYGNHLFIGGNFTTAGKKKVNNIASWNLVTKTWSVLGGGVNGEVHAIKFKNGEIYVAGGFTSAGGVPANNIAKWNGHEWSALGDGVNGRVNALTVCGDDLYVGGGFSQAGGNTARNIAKWNAKDKTWSPLGAGVDGGVTALASDGHVVYVSGGFFYVDEMQAGFIVKWDPAKSCWSLVGSRRHAEGGDVNGPVFSMLNRGNEVYLGGKFSRAGGKPSQLFAIWHEPASPKPHAPAWSKVPDVAFRHDRTTQIELYQYVTDTEHDLRGGLNFSATVINSQLGANANDLKIRLEKVIMGPGGRYEYANFSAARNTSGFYTVVFTVTDVCGNAASDTIRVTVTPLNGAPIIAPLPELTFNEDDSLLHPIRNWYDYVTDVVNPDSALFFRIFSSREVKAERRDKSFLFTAAPNWFGVSRLKLVVRDRRGLADTTTLVVKVNPVNDPPVWRDLPDSLVLKPGVATTLNLWEFADDLETPDSLLHFNFVSGKPGFDVDFNKKTGKLSLSAGSRGRLYVTVRDWKRAAARDTIFIRVESSSVTKVAAGGEQLPTELVLQQNYPNPFNPTTLIRFGLPQDAEVKLEIFNLAGQHVATLLNARKAAGYHEVIFDAGHLPSGNYFTVLRAGEARLMRRIVLMK